MKGMKSIHFPPPVADEMVRAILEGRKTVMRRVVKPHFRDNEIGFNVITNAHTGKYVRIEYFDEWEDETRYMPEPYRPGDILYVRETWQYMGTVSADSRIADQHIYQADWSGEKPLAWRPSIHMPREAARIFLRVTDVRVERLHDIVDTIDMQRDFGFAPEAISAIGSERLAQGLWDTTIKPADRALYGWAADPWVWDIEFERCEEPKGSDDHA